MSKDIQWEEVIGYSYLDKDQRVIELEVIVREPTPHSNEFLLEEEEIQKARKTAQLFMPKVIERDEIMEGRPVRIVEYHLPAGAVLDEHRMYYYADISAALDTQDTPENEETITDIAPNKALEKDDKAFIDNSLRNA